MMKMKRKAALLLIICLTVGMLSASPGFVLALEAGSGGAAANGYGAAALKSHGTYDTHGAYDDHGAYDTHGAYDARGVYDARGAYDARDAYESEIIYRGSGDAVTPGCDCAVEAGGHAAGCPGGAGLPCGCEAGSGSHTAGCPQSAALPCGCETGAGDHISGCPQSAALPCGCEAGAGDHISGCQQSATLPCGCEAGSGSHTAGCPQSAALPCGCQTNTGSHTAGCPQSATLPCGCEAGSGSHAESCPLNNKPACSCGSPDGADGAGGSPGWRHDKTCPLYEAQPYKSETKNRPDNMNGGQSAPLYDGPTLAHFPGAQREQGLIRSADGKKNAYINGSSAAVNGTAADPAMVELGDKIKYTVSTDNYKKPGAPGVSGAKYDVLFVLDWSESMNGTMVPGQSARLYEKDVMLDMCDFVLSRYPDSRVAVMGMNAVGMNNRPTESFIQFQTDFLDPSQYKAKLPDIQAAFNIAPRNTTEDLVSFLKAAYQKMTGQTMPYGSASVGGVNNTIPRGGKDVDERIPVIMLISDFQIPSTQLKSEYWSYYMKTQADNFATKYKNGVLHTVRFDHSGNHAGGNAVYSTAQYDGYMTKYVAPAGRSHWRFTKVDRNTHYTDALTAIKGDFAAVIPPGPELGTIITDKVPEGLEVDGSSISHGGRYDQATRTITWDLAKEKEGAVTVSFTATVKKDGEFENTAAIAFPDGAGARTNTTYHKAGGNMDIIISKTVDGSYSDKNRDFKFSLTLLSMDVTKPLESGTAFNIENGVIYGSGATAPAYKTLTLGWEPMLVFSLKHGQAVTIKDIPSHLVIKLEEEFDKNFIAVFVDSGDGSTGDNDSGYKLVKTDEGIRAFDFFNTRIFVPPTGLADSGRFFATIILFAALTLFAGFAAVKLVLRRSRSA